MLSALGCFELGKRLLASSDAELELERELGLGHGLGPALELEPGPELGPARHASNT